MTPADPTQLLWWLASRASGIVALGLISISVLVGLLMSTKSVRRPALKRSLLRLHEHVALAGLVAISVHGLTLLGDHWLKPGLTGITIPFALSYRPLFTAAGIVGGYLAAALGLSYYARRRIGARLWRRLHRATVIVWALGVVHTLGAGSDASTVWLRAIVLTSGVPIVYLGLVRILPALGRTATTPPPARAPRATPQRSPERPAADAPPAHPAHASRSQRAAPRVLRPLGEDAS